VRPLRWTAPDSRRSAATGASTKRKVVGPREKHLTARCSDTSKVGRGIEVADAPQQSSGAATGRMPGAVRAAGLPRAPGHRHRPGLGDPLRGGPAAQIRITANCHVEEWLCCLGNIPSLGHGTSDQRRGRVAKQEGAAPDTAAVRDGDSGPRSASGATSVRMVRAPAGRAWWTAAGRDQDEGRSSRRGLSTACDARGAESRRARAEARRRHQVGPGAFTPNSQAASAEARNTVSPARARHAGTKDGARPGAARKRRALARTRCRRNGDPADVQWSSARPDTTASRQPTPAVVSSGGGRTRRSSTQSTPSADRSTASSSTRTSRA